MMGELDCFAFVVVFILCWISAPALEQCSVDRGGGQCPTGTTCCALSNGKSGCIADDLGKYNATCCSDGATGCAVNYTCGHNNTCIATKSITDPLVQLLPRYHLCHVPDELWSLHGLPIVHDAKLAYYSSHGDLTRIGQRSDHKTIRMILVVVHGAARNADEYFCATMSAVSRQHYYESSSVLVIVPRFPVFNDTDLDLLEGGVAIRWVEDGDGGPWRHGANAIQPDAISNQNFSSFEGLDRILQTLLKDPGIFPKLKAVRLVGHSAGGQFVQRWSLMTAVWDSRFRTIAANPSSFVYMSPERYSIVDREWQIPLDANCPGYNQWKWGLDKGGNYTMSYINDVMDVFPLNYLRIRFALRNVVYLAGSLDKCNVSGMEPGWCASHGLETNCQDNLEGTNRWERHFHYMASLQRNGIIHRRFTVNGVGHDHSMMFNSPNGLTAIFAPLPRQQEIPIMN